MFSLNLDRCQTTENLLHSLFSKRFINILHRKLHLENCFHISWTFSMVLDDWSSFSFRGWCSFLTVPLNMPLVKNVLTVFFSHAHFSVSALIFAFQLHCSNWEQIMTTMVVPVDFWVCWKVVLTLMNAAVINEFICLGEMLWIYLQLFKKANIGCLRTVLPWSQSSCVLF